MLVAAVLGPEQGEDRQLEMVGVPLEQLLDARKLPVGESEGSVQGLIRYLRQVIDSSREGRRRRLRCDLG